MFNGIIIINKAKNISSHDVVNKLRKIFAQKNIGHTGTLDPIATGVLVMCLGRATKIAEYISSETKKYHAKIKLGIRTDSFDLTGKIISLDKFIYDQEKFNKTLEKFRGEYLQEPPMFSAIKKNGKRLYELARAGIKINLTKRLVRIDKLDLIKFIFPDEAILNITCSKGTYIRSLCEDIGRELKCGAALSDLNRIQVGKFKLKDSVNLDQDLEILKSKIIKIEDALEFKKIFIANEANKFLYNGAKINIKFIINHESINLNHELFFVYDSMKNLIGIYKCEDNYLKIIKTLR